MTGAFEAAAAAQDAALEAAGLRIWVGSEPTFTDRLAETPEWLSEALGGDKEARGRELLALLAAHSPGALVLRTVGRQYGGEPRARWSYGLYARRDGRPLWAGPPDPLLGEAAGAAVVQTDRALRDALAEALAARGCAVVDAPPGGETDARLAFRLDGAAPMVDPEQRPEWRRDSLHARPLPAAGAADGLAEAGDYLVAIAVREVAGGSSPVPVIELPAFPDVGAFLAFLDALQAAAAAAGVANLVLRGFPPPVDDSVAFTTVTPDPAVIEVNMAPAADAATFLRWHRTLFAAAGKAGLSPLRFHYNGAVSDSGGGGQITLGGATPPDSPFFAHPQLLPRLVRYLLRHPALSYCFATDYVGGASQAPRPDEGSWDRLRELEVALGHLGDMRGPSPELLWSSLSHFLCDVSGNPHRSELNIEKLWNPFLPGRGRLGLVEFRAFRMQPSAEAATALALLLRAVCAMLVRADVAPETAVWGRELHERFALPHYLSRDLDEVYADLAAHGAALPEAVREWLLPPAHAALGEVSRPGLSLRVDAALEFWPLLGDVASQEGGGSRTVDASTRRLQVLLRADDEDELAAWEVAVNGWRLPLRRERDAQGGAVDLLGVRYRAFKPWRGLHPSVPAQDPLTFTLTRAGGESLRARLHEWTPSGEAYPALPADADEARRRRDARFVAAPPAREAPRAAPARALTGYTLDLRCLGD